MNFGFKIINPLITPKLKEDTKSTDLRSFSVLLNKTTGHVEQEIENENGLSQYNGKIDMEKMFSGFPGSLIKKKIDQYCPEASKILLRMDYLTQELQIVYLDNADEILTYKKLK